jgi:hypothetical protein
LEYAKVINYIFFAIDFISYVKNSSGVIHSFSESVDSSFLQPLCKKSYEIFLLLFISS